MSECHPSNVCWLSGDRLFASCCAPDNKLVVLRAASDGDDLLEVEQEVPLEAAAFAVARSPSGEWAAVQLVDGTVLKWDSGKRGQSGDIGRSSNR